MRALCLLLLLSFFAFESTAQTGWSVLNIPNSGRYDDVFFINDSVGWAAGGPNGWIRKTADGGQSWALQYTSPYYLRSIEFVDANVGYCGSLNGQLYRTANGGATWTDISASMSPPPQGICGLSTPDASTVYGCGLWAGPAYIYKSTDGGSSWSHMDMSAYATRLVDVHFTHPDTGFVTGTATPASNGGVILHTTDGGASWTVVHTTHTITDIVWKIQRLDADHWFASIYSEPVNDDTRTLRSADGGMSWEQITVSDSYTYVEAVGFINALHGWTGGEDLLWETLDGGTSWELVDLGYNYNRFFKVNDSTAFLSGQRIYKYQEDLGTPVPDAEARSTWHALRVLPNPNDGRFTIELRLDRTTIADLRIVASDGRTVQQLLKRPTAAGEQRFTVDLSGNAGARYFVVLKSNEGMRWESVMVGR